MSVYLEREVATSRSRATSRGRGGRAGRCRRHRRDRVRPLRLSCGWPASAHACRHQQQDHDPPRRQLVRHYRFARATARPAGSGRTRKAPRLIAGLIPEATGSMGTDMRLALTERRELIEQRATALTDTALTDRAPWVAALGKPPEEARSAEVWIRQVQTVAAFGDRYDITTEQPLGAPAESEAQKIDAARAQAAILSSRPRKTVGQWLAHLVLRGSAVQQRPAVQRLCTLARQRPSALFGSERFGREPADRPAVGCPSGPRRAAASERRRGPRSGLGAGGTRFGAKEVVPPT